MAEESNGEINSKPTTHLDLKEFVAKADSLLKQNDPRRVKHYIRNAIAAEADRYLSTDDEGREILDEQYDDTSSSIKDHMVDLSFARHAKEKNINRYASSKESLYPPEIAKFLEEDNDENAESLFAPAMKHLVDRFEQLANRLGSNPDEISISLEDMPQKETFELMQSLVESETNDWQEYVHSKDFAKFKIASEFASNYLAKNQHLDKVKVSLVEKDGTWEPKPTYIFGKEYFTYNKRRVERTDAILGVVEQKQREMSIIKIACENLVKGKRLDKNLYPDFEEAETNVTYEMHLISYLDAKMAAFKHDQEEVTIALMELDLLDQSDENKNEIRKKMDKFKKALEKSEKYESIFAAFGEKIATYDPDEELETSSN